MQQFHFLSMLHYLEFLYICNGVLSPVSLTFSPVFAIADKHVFFSHACSCWLVFPACLSGRSAACANVDYPSLN